MYKLYSMSGDGTYNIGIIPCPITLKDFQKRLVLSECEKIKQNEYWCTKQSCLACDLCIYSVCTAKSREDFIIMIDKLIAKFKK